METRGAAFDHAWRYFELHANQRMSVFNFFLVLGGLVAAGLAGIAQGPEKLAPVGAVLGLLLAVAAYIFWKLDQRVAFLIKYAEAALSELEKDLPTAASKLFSNEPGLTRSEQSAGNRWNRLWTYGRSFRVMFWVVGLIGVVASVLCSLRLAGVLTW